MSCTCAHWGGHIELALFVMVENGFQVLVYEEHARTGNYQSMQVYGADDRKDSVRLLYRNACHWDVLLVDDE